MNEEFISLHDLKTDSRFLSPHVYEGVCYVFTRYLKKACVGVRLGNELTLSCKFEILL